MNYGLIFVAIGGTIAGIILGFILGRIGNR